MPGHQDARFRGGPGQPPREITLVANSERMPAIKMRDFAGTPGRRAILASRSGRSNEVLTLRLRMQL